MKANPGGYISPDEVIGRDALIDRLWRVLVRQSLVLCAERRIGKTSIINKMKAEAQKGLLPVYRDLEGLRTTDEFSNMVFRDVSRYLSTSNRVTEGARRFMEQFGGAGIGEFVKIPENFLALPWKIRLTRTIEALTKHQDEQGQMMILFWDEVPSMLYAVGKREGEDVAMEVLDTLRELRQMHPNLRMVFTGSIGLHNVITSLKRSGYANDPTNDMYTMDVPPLSSADAQELARRLLEGEGILTDDLLATTQAIAETVDCIPFYIHSVVEEMVTRDSSADEGTIDEIVDGLLIDPQDPLHMSHYRDRVDTYYRSDERPFALGLLDILAVSEHPVPFDDLLNLLKSRIETEDTEMVRDMLTLLQRDHYVIQQTDGTYRFRFSLIQHWWRLNRGQVS